MRALGAELVEHGVDFQAAREEAERRAAAGGLEMVPSFHRDLVRGVATYALELLNAVPDLATLYVPIGRSLDGDEVAKPIQGRVQVAYSTAHRLAEAQFSFTLPFTGSLLQRI